MESVLESHVTCASTLKLSTVRIRLVTTELQRMKRKSITVSWGQADARGTDRDRPRHGRLAQRRPFLKIQSRFPRSRPKRSLLLQERAGERDARSRERERPGPQSRGGLGTVAPISLSYVGLWPWNCSFGRFSLDVRGSSPVRGLSCGTRAPPLFLGDSFWGTRIFGHRSLECLFPQLAGGGPDSLSLSLSLSLSRRFVRTGHGGSARRGAFAQHLHASAGASLSPKCFLWRDRESTEGVLHSRGTRTACVRFPSDISKSHRVFHRSQTPTDCARPDRAVLIELSIDGSSANRHFHNLASRAGVSHGKRTFEEEERGSFFENSRRFTGEMARSQVRLQVHGEPGPARPARVARQIDHRGTRSLKALLSDAFLVGLRGWRRGRSYFSTCDLEAESRARVRESQHSRGWSSSSRALSLSLSRERARSTFRSRRPPPNIRTYSTLLNSL